MHDKMLFTVKRVELGRKMWVQFVRIVAIFKLGTHCLCSAVFAELM